VVNHTFSRPIPVGLSSSAPSPVLNHSAVLTSPGSSTSPQSSLSSFGCTPLGDSPESPAVRGKPYSARGLLISPSLFSRPRIRLAGPGLRLQIAPRSRPKLLFSSEPSPSSHLAAPPPSPGPAAPAPSPGPAAPAPSPYPGCSHWGDP
jgi:hypothetical protein